MSSIFYTALHAVREAIIGLDLEGVDRSSIRVRRFPHDGEVYYRGITVHPVRESTGPGTNMLEDIGYGCGLTMVVNNNNASERLLDRVLMWRETIRRYFVENDTLDTMSTVFTVKVEHDDVFAWDDMVRSNFDVSRMVLRVWSRESRT